MPRKIYVLNQKDSQDNSSKKKEETLAEKLQREAEEKVRETIMPEAKAEVRKELAKEIEEIEEMKRQAIAKIEEEKRKLKEREKKFQEQIDSANEEIQKKVDSTNALIDKTNALISKTNVKPKRLKSAQKRTEMGTKKKSKQEEHEKQDSQEKQESVGLKEIEKVEVEPIGTDDYTLKFRKYRKRKIEEYKKITGNDSIEPGPEEMTIITVNNKVIKVTQQDIEKLKKATYISNIDELIGEEKGKVKVVIVGDDIAYIQNNLFFWQCKMQDIIFNENLKEIEKMAFYSIALQEVMLPPNLRSIGTRSFCCCRCLKNVVFGEKVEEIGDLAFECNDLLEEVIFSHNLRIIRPCAFKGCYNLKRVTFRENIEEIDDFAFSRTKLEEVILPSTAMFYGQPFDDEVKITRKPPEEMRKSRISHQDVARTVTEQLLDEEKIGELRTSTELQEKVEEQRS